jgi:hypothetical protein
MDQATAALLGAITGFFLPSLASYIRSRMKGARFENAVKGEIEGAKDSLHQKMLWVSRDQSPFKSQTAERLLVEFDGKLLYLGEQEDFCVSLPFWEQNIRDIIEVSSTKSFNDMCRKVLLLRKFVSKFREMKLTFNIGGGDPKQMALACYQDLVKIHDELIPDRSPAATQ